MQNEAAAQGNFFAQTFILSLDLNHTKRFHLKAEGRGVPKSTPHSDGKCEITFNHNVVITPVTRWAQQPLQGSHPDPTDTHLGGQDRLIAFPPQPLDFGSRVLCYYDRAQFL